MRLFYTKQVWSYCTYTLTREAASADAAAVSTRFDALGRSNQGTHEYIAHRTGPGRSVCRGISGLAFPAREDGGHKRMCAAHRAIPIYLRLACAMQSPPPPPPLRTFCHHISANALVLFDRGHHGFRVHLIEHLSPSTLHSTSQIDPSPLPRLVLSLALNPSPHNSTRFPGTFSSQKSDGHSNIHAPTCSRTALA